MNSALQYNTDVEIEIFENSPIFTIRNFYKNPKHLLELLDNNPTKLWKSWEEPSNNGKMFLDQRHEFVNEDMVEISKFLSGLCKQSAIYSNKILTNKHKFLDYDFNDYFNSYWAPHLDLGFTALIYLNQEGDTGTNLYRCIGLDNWDTPEHFKPWRPKKEYQVIKTLKAEFNKLVMFDGKKFLHGMAVKDDYFFKHHRLNQVIFFLDQK